MAKKIIVILFALLVLSYSSFPVEASTEAQNNRVGIHIHDENDLDDAARLVNSSGGDWGYVTLVIREDERDPVRWQRVFNRMRELHLIPIVRIGTRQEDSYWAKPKIEGINTWVTFFMSLNWVVKPRYIVIGNEPNHAKEWGGIVNPEEYGEYLKTFARKLVDTSGDFVPLPAGFDASAPNNGELLSETEFLKRMLSAHPNAFEHIKGWTSHSYPNPGFSGKKDDVGRGTIKTYVWELDYLKSLGVTKDLPVFITETGWAHDMGENNIQLKNEEEVGQNLKYAFESAWNDPRVVVVTPFIINYQTAPFNIFSWKKETGEFYKFYFDVQDMPKISGEPEQIKSGVLLSTLVPPVISINGERYGLALARNTGQSIWEQRKYTAMYERNNEYPVMPSNPISAIEPGEEGIVIFSQPNVLGIMHFRPVFDTIFEPLLN